jgi:hypothetical protein
MSNDTKIIHAFLSRMHAAVHTVRDPNKFTEELHGMVRASVPVTRAGLSPELMGILLNHASDLWCERPAFIFTLPSSQLLDSWINVVQHIQSETENPKGAKLGFLLFVSLCMDEIWKNHRKV